VLLAIEDRATGRYRGVGRCPVVGPVRREDLVERQLTGVGCTRWRSSSPPRHGWERAVEVVDRIEHPALGVPRIAEEQAATS